MNFKKGDQVVHKNFGVGIVAAIESMDLAKDGGQSPYYRIDFYKTSVWVPASNPTENVLRPITPKSHLSRYRALLKSSPVLLDGDFNERRSELEKRIGVGTFQGLCEVIRDLSALNAEKPFNNYERTLYKQTREALVLEWSASSGFSKSKSILEIDRCLKRRK